MKLMNPRSFMVLKETLLKITLAPQHGGKAALASMENWRPGGAMMWPLLPVLKALTTDHVAGETRFPKHRLKILPIPDVSNGRECRVQRSQQLSNYKMT